MTLLLALSACSDHAVKVLEAEPTGEDSGQSVGPTDDSGQTSMSAPQCSITDPAEDALVAMGDDTVLGGTATDQDQSPDTLSVMWSSDHDGSLANSTPNSEGSFTFTTSDLSAAVHVISLTVTDTDDLTCTDTRALTVGARPTLEITSPTSDADFAEGETVVLSATVEDDDDSLDDLSVVWTSDLDGEVADVDGEASAATSSLSPGVHVLSATATDPHGLVGNDTVSITVDGLPTTPEITLSPNPASTLEDLEVVFDTESVDPEGETITYDYQWTVNGGPSSASSSDLLESSFTTRDEVWGVEVTPSDGVLLGESGWAEITISNSLPSIDSTSLSPSTPTTDETLTVSFTTSDGDGESVDVDIDWTVDGVSTGTTDTTLSGDWFSKDEVVEVTLTPQDSSDVGSASSTSVVVQNTPPEAPAVEITPTAPDTSSDLVCIASASDLDGDSLSYQFDWTLDGAPFTGTTTTILSGDTVPAVSLAALDEWICTVTANDGDDDGESASDSVTLCDGDGDGHGDESCGGFDCDDSDPGIHPDAGDVCEDGIDSDCDGFDETCGHDSQISLSDAWAKILGESSGDVAGFSVGMADLSGDGVADFLVGAYDAGSGGTAYVVEGPVTGTHYLSSADESWSAVASTDRAGISLESVGDLDGDGYDEALVGADHAYGYSGAAFLITGPIDSGGSLVDAHAVIRGSASMDYTGFGVAPADDTDGDGIRDLLVGVHGNDDAAYEAGGAVLFLGPVSGSMTIADADAKLLGEAEQDNAGFSLDGAGDVDGDGLADVLVASYQHDAESGAVYLMLGPISGTVSLSDSDAKIIGGSAGDLVGYSVAGRGDLDGDGLADLAVGSIVYPTAGYYSGAAWFIWQTVSGIHEISDVADATHLGEDEYHQAGYDVCIAGDIDGDGGNDGVIGANGDTTGGAYAGALYVITEHNPGTWSLSSANHKITGENTWDMVGNDSSCKGDADGDGRDDLLIGALGDDTEGTNAGAAYVLLSHQL